MSIYLFSGCGPIKISKSFSVVKVVATKVTDFEIRCVTI